MTSSIAGYELATVARGLFIHPVKACAPVAVNQFVLDERGAATGDREWAIVNDRDELTWQGSHARLTLVHPRLAGDGIVLTAQGLGEIATPPAAALEPCRIEIWNDSRKTNETFDALDAGPDVARWLTEACGAPLRLVRLGAQALAREGPAALHLVFMPSMAAVDAELAGQGHAAAGVGRYRPNILLDAAPGVALDAFVEDSVQALDWRGGDGRALRLDVTAPCIRCILPNIDPSTAQSDPATLTALETLSQRRAPGQPTVFGIYARGPAGARLRVGDTAQLELAF